MHTILGGEIMGTINPIKSKIQDRIKTLGWYSENVKSQEAIKAYQREIAWLKNLILYSDDVFGCVKEWKD